MVFVHKNAIAIFCFYCYNVYTLNNQEDIL